MVPRALILTMMGVVGCAARGETAAGTRPEQTDLQAVQAAEMAVAIQAQAGKDTQKAVERLDQVYAGLEVKYPQSATVLDEHGNFLFASNRSKDAFLKWQAAEKLDGNNADVCEHLGACWLNDGETRRAIGYFQRAVGLAPADASLHFALGNELYLFRHELTTAGEPETAVVDRALAELRKASELEPLDAEYATGYAATFYSIPVPKWPEALKAWQHYYDISPDKDVAAINLARVSLQMKDMAGARKYLEIVRGGAFQGLKRKLLAQAGDPQ
jgi:tetratricopeptide (TPR) repeat protein